MKRTTRNAERTKREIIEKSAPVFNVHGFAGTSMGMLVEATGFKMGGIYRHFKTKKDLAQAVFLYNYEVLIRTNLEFAEGLSPKEKLLSVLAGYKQMIINPVVPGGCPLLNTATEMDDTDDDFRQLVKASVDEICTILKDVLQEGKAKGEIDPALDHESVAHFLFSTVEGAILLGKTTRSGTAIFGVLQQIERYLEAMVFVR